MNDSAAPTAKTINAGVERLCKDFTAMLLPMGFRRTTSKSKFWRRANGNIVEQIHMQRSGSGRAPINSTVSVEVCFSTHPASAQPPFALNGPCSSKLKNSAGYHYHLRFNALTWSTYDRCIADLERVLLEHGLPWFSRPGA